MESRGRAGWRAAFAAGALLVLARLAHATVVALLVSPSPAGDGTALQSFETPVARSRDDILFFGRTSAVSAIRDGQHRIVAQTGTSLSAPLAGTINGVAGTLLAADGTIAIAATLNDPAAPCGILLAKDGVLSPVDAYYGRNYFECDVIAMNERGDLLFRIGIDTRLRRSTDGFIAPLPLPAFATVISLGADGSVLFMHDDALIVRPAGGDSDVPIIHVGDEIGGGKLRTLRNLRAAVGPSGSVAFLARIRGRRPSTVAFVARPDDGFEPRELADGIEPYLGVTASGDFVLKLSENGHRSRLVAYGTGYSRIVARLPPGASQVSTRIAAGDRVTWVRNGVLEARNGFGPIATVLAVDAHPLGPGFASRAAGIADDGTVAVASERTSLYRFHDGRLDLVLQPGMRLADGERVDSVGNTHEYVGDSIWAGAQTRAGARLVSIRHGRPKILLASADPAPERGRFEDPSQLRLRVIGRRVVFDARIDVPGSDYTQQGVFRTGLKGRKLKSVVGVGDRVAGVPAENASVIGGTGDELAVQAWRSRGPTILLLTDGVSRRMVAKSDIVAPGGLTFDSFSSAGGTADLLLFGTYVRSGDQTAQTKQALFSVERESGLMRRVAVEGAPAPDGGVFGYSTPLEGLPWFAASKSTEYGYSIYEATPSGPRKLFGPKTAVLGSTPLVSAEQAWPVPGGVLLWAQQGDDEHWWQGYFRVENGVVTPLVVSEQPTPAGGTLVSVSSASLVGSTLIFGSGISYGPANQGLFRAE